MSYLRDPFAVPQQPAAPATADDALVDAAVDAESRDGRSGTDTTDAAPAPSADEAPASPAAGQAATTQEGGPSTPAPEKATQAGSEDAAPPAVLLDRPRDGVPDVVVDERTLSHAAAVLGAGSGPLAVDAERASGYRYGQRAYLVQLRREGAGTWLLDPVACPDLSPVAQAIADAEWILHAATQDLPCLREVGLAPSSLVDTELGARLAGRPRVGLAAVIEHYLGYALAKEHSAVDWSTRPLPEPWLRYAALDVELLIDLREALLADLDAQGKLQWAREEFEFLTHFTGPPVRPDPWRRTSGMHKVRSRRTVAVVREIWYARDDLAKRRDISPGRVLPDAALMAVAVAAPRTTADLAAASTHKNARRHQGEWLEAIERALQIPEDDLPAAALPADGPPPQRSWGDRDPVAAARLVQARADLGAFADAHELPVENLLTPDTLRRVIWSPPQDPSEDAVDAALTSAGARPWQRRICTPVIVKALADHV